MVMASSSRQSHGYGDDYDSDDEKEYDGTPGKKIWSVQATEFYIRLLDKYKEKLFSPEAQAAHFTVKNGMWSDLTDEMIRAGYQLNQPQCRKKLENLKRGFNNCSPRKLVKFISLPNGLRKKVVSTSRSWPFYSQFLPIMNYIAANKIGIDKSVTLKRAAPILAAAQQELEASSNGTFEEEEEVSENIPIDNLFGYNSSSAGEFANGLGLENGQSEIKSIVASAFDTSDFGYGTGGVMSLQGIGGAQEYYQLQSLNAQPNTDGDIVVQVYDQNGLSVPVKMEPVENFYETTTTTELEPVQFRSAAVPRVQPVQVQPTCSANVQPVKVEPVQVQPVQVQDVQTILPDSVPITSRPEPESVQQATVTSVVSVPVPASSPVVPTATISTTTSGPIVPTVLDAGGAHANGTSTGTRRLSARPKKPTEKLRASGIISIADTTKHNNNPSSTAPVTPVPVLARAPAPTPVVPVQNQVTTTTNSNGTSTPTPRTSTPARQHQQQQRRQPTTMETATAKETVADSSSSNPSTGTSSATNANANGKPISVLASATPAPVVAVASPSTSPTPTAAAAGVMRPELERVLIEELQGVRQEMRTLNRNIEKMVDVHNRMNDTLERFLTALRIRQP